MTKSLSQNTITMFADKQHELDFPEADEDEEPQKPRDIAKKGSIVPRGSDIMSKIIAQRDVTITSAFKDEEVPAAGVLTDHQAELNKVIFRQQFQEQNLLLPLLIDLKQHQHLGSRCVHSK